jgi:nucleotide-binding universal stress UspA family protein
VTLSPPIVLLATDGSEDAALAARAAIGLCETTGSELHVVHAWRSVPSTHFDAFLRVQFEKEGREVLDAAVGRGRARRSPLPTSLVFRKLVVQTFQLGPHGEGKSPGRR